MSQCLGVPLFVSYSVGDGALGFGHASQTLYHWKAPQLVTHACKNQTFLLRGPALGVMLGGTGPLLAQQWGHLLSISVLHSLQQAVVILVPLVGLGSERLRKRGEWLQPHRCQTKPSSQPAAPQNAFSFTVGTPPEGWFLQRKHQQLNERPGLSKLWGTVTPFSYPSEGEAVWTMGQFTH